MEEKRPPQVTVFFITGQYLLSAALITAFLLLKFEISIMCKSVRKLEFQSILHCADT